MKYPALKSMMTGIAATTLVLISQVFALPGSNKDVLSQKILLENTIHQRVSDAVYRILRHENFIVNVNVVMEVSPTQQYTTIYETPETKAKLSPERMILNQSAGKTKPGAPAAQTTSTTPAGEPKTRTVLKKRPIQTNIPADIPGFPGIQSPGFELYEEEVPIEEDKTNDVVYAAEEDLSRLVSRSDTTASIAAEASLSLDENEVILEEDLDPVTQPKTTDETLVEYSDIQSPHMSKHTVASTTGPTLSVKKMELTVILEDPVSPQIIENIRTVTMVASHFNRERGDKLQVMTADFQGAKSNKPDTEQLLLKSIAEKMTAIEARQKEDNENKKIKELETQQERLRMEQANKEAQQREMDRLRAQELDKQKAHEEELTRIRQAEENRIRQREEELNAMRQQEQARLAEERRQLFEAQQEQAHERLRQDSLRLALLTEQLSDLKKQLSSVDLEEEQRLKLELEQKRREAERSAIRDREEELRKQLENIENQRLQANVLPEEKNDLLPVLIIGAAVLLLLAIIVGAMMGGRSRRPDLLPTSTAPEHPEEPVAEKVPEKPPLAEEPEKPAEPEVDAELMGEVDSIKKSVVSLAVSKPGSASSIVKEWLQDTGEEQATEEVAEAEEQNGKKKKKGSK